MMAPVAPMGAPPIDPEKGYVLVHVTTDVPLTSVHPQGTTPMGGSADSAVRPNGTLRGTRRVRIADASVFPGSVGVPPQVSIMTMGSLVADALIAERAS